MKKKILISTGGSGGHVIPATSLYEHLENKFEVSIDSSCYYRCEVELKSDGKMKRFALTNPIWFEISVEE